MLLVAAGFFLLVYENMRRPLIEQGLRRTPWVAPRLTVAGDLVTLESVMAPQTVRFSDVVRARLVYQESFDALVGIDDTLTLELVTGTLEVPRSALGFDTLLQHLRLAGIGIRMVRARMAID
jgi:hypothetical protein